MIQNLMQDPAQKVTFIGGLINLFLSFIKIITGLIFNSASLVADGLHSLSDLISDFFAIMMLKISGKKADDDHPWGHGRFETLGTAILGFILLALGGIIIYDSAINLIINTQIAIHSWQAIIIVIFSILIKEWLYHYTLKVGKKLGSNLIIANAWHHRSDSLSSIAVLIGLIGVALGYNSWDAIAAIVVAILISKMGFKFLYQSAKELVDTALDEKDTSEIEAIIRQVDGVINVHDLKTRLMGSQSVLEMHLQVAPFLSASESHQIGDKVVNKLKDKASMNFAHIIYHIDTYDDEDEKYEKIYAKLPIRNEIEKTIKAYLNDVDKDLLPFRITLFYHKGKMQIELVLSQENLFLLAQKEINPKDLITGIKKSLHNPKWISTIRLLWFVSDESNI